MATPRDRTGSNTIKWVATGPQTGSASLAVYAATQYVAFGSAYRRRAKPSVARESGTVGAKLPKMDADHTTLVKWRLVGAEPYCGSRARRYAQVTRESPMRTPMAASLVSATWRTFVFGFGGGGRPDMVSRIFSAVTTRTACSTGESEGSELAGDERVGDSSEELVWGRHGRPAWRARRPDRDVPPGKLRGLRSRGAHT